MSMTIIKWLTGQASIWTSAWSVACNLLSFWWARRQSFRRDASPSKPDASSRTPSGNSTSRRRPLSTSTSSEGTCCRSAAASGRPETDLGTRRRFAWSPKNRNEGFKLMLFFRVLRFFSCRHNVSFLRYTQEKLEHHTDFRSNILYDF